METTPDVRTGDLKTSLSVQRCNAFKKGGEKVFLGHVLEVLSGWDPEWARNELKNSGAWWLTRHRKDQDTICRVLAEIGRMIKEGEKFTENPGAAAVDLWKRWA